MIYLKKITRRHFMLVGGSTIFTASLILFFQNCGRGFFNTQIGASDLPATSAIAGRAVAGVTIAGKI